MRIAKFQRTIISAMAVLTFSCILAGFYRASQRTLNLASAKQESGQPQDGAKRKWSWLSPLPPFLELVEIKNLDSDDWVTDLQIKVRNKSDKPIVYIDFFVFTPDLKNDYGYDFDTYFFFGDYRVWSEGKASDDDKRLQPGEEVVLTHGEAYKKAVLKRFERALSQRRDLSPSDLRLEISPHYTMFSDGTKYNGRQWLRGTGPRQSSTVPKYPDNLRRASFAPSSIQNFLPVKKRLGRQFSNKSCIFERNSTNWRDLSLVFALR